jgi:stress-induced morphogen
LHKGHNNFDGNDETHIYVQLLKKSKFTENRLEVHRKINSLLTKEFKKGLHSLEIKII